jgi:mRNA interferase MazF
MGVSMGERDPVRRFEVYSVRLDPTLGSEIKKTRPCLIISPNEMNKHIRTVIVAPMTSKGRMYPTRIDCVFQKISGQIVLDQIRTIDKSRLARKMGMISPVARRKVINGLLEMFAL